MSVQSEFPKNYAGLFCLLTSPSPSPKTMSPSCTGTPPSSICTPSAPSTLHRGTVSAAWLRLYKADAAEAAGGSSVHALLALRARLHYIMARSQCRGSGNTAQRQRLSQVTARSQCNEETGRERQWRGGRRKEVKRVGRIVLCRVLPLPLLLRQCLCLVLPLPFVGNTASLPCGYTALPPTPVHSLWE